MLTIYRLPFPKLKNNKKHKHKTKNKKQNTPTPLTPMGMLTRFPILLNLTSRFPNPCLSGHPTPTPDYMAVICLRKTAEKSYCTRALYGGTACKFCRLHRGEDGSPGLWNLQNLHAVPPYKYQNLSSPRGTKSSRPFATISIQVLGYGHKGRKKRWSGLGGAVT